MFEIIRKIQMKLSMFLESQLAILQGLRKFEKVNFRIYNEYKYKYKYKRIK